MNQTEVHQLQHAQQSAIAIRPKVGGFPIFADSLLQSGITRNVWHLPSCQSTYFATFGVVIQQGTPLVSGSTSVAPFDEQALIEALRRDQRGEGSFPEFLQSSWEAGVVSYEVDFVNRVCTYFGVNGEAYIENYAVPNE
jgi:uncharacterized protein YbcV (DUF1398 family)